MLKIGEFSKLAQVSPKALRIYDERGLLRPAWIDRFSGYRYYRPAQLARLHTILALKDLGFTLEQIGELLDGDMSAAELEGMMRERQRALSRHIAAEEARLLRVQARLRQLEQADSVPRSDVVLKTVRPLTVAGMRRTLARQDDLAGLLNDFRLLLRRRALDLPVPVLGIYYDPVYREDSLDVEVAAPLAGKLGSASGIKVHDLPGEELMACTVYRGAYEGLPAAYETVFAWLESSGYRAAGPNRDLFLQVPLPGEALEKAVTEVQIPVRPKPYLSPVAKLKDKEKMEIKIVTKPAFTVVGLPYFGTNETKEEIPEVWANLMPRMAEISHKTGPAFGLCTEPQGDGRFHYLAGFGVSEVEELPESMEEWTVPEQTYAVFPCELSTIHEAYQFAFETWLPQSDYRHDKHGIDFELYTEEFDPQTGDEVLFVYVPVLKK
jgi:predicted transcriptional regulator YdeE/DNA-binding transcriptional MerR regulator